MLCCQRCETPQREPGCGSAVFTPLRRWTQLPSPAPLRAPCPPLASAVRTTLATATAGLHHRAWLPGGCSFQTRLSACLSAISFLSCLSIRGIDFWAAFAALIAVWARQHWDVGARSANKNPVVVQAWATLPWHCRKWRFSRLKSTGSKASAASPCVPQKLPREGSSTASRHQRGDASFPPVVYIGFTVGWGQIGPVGSSS